MPADSYLFILIFIFLTAVKIAFANENEQQNQVTEERSSKLHTYHPSSILILNNQ